jgi:hypothetical protein
MPEGLKRKKKPAEQNPPEMSTEGRQRTHCFDSQNQLQYNLI